MERDTIFYLLNSVGNRRDFIPGTVVDEDDAEMTIDLSQRGLQVGSGDDIKLHFKYRGQFLNRSYRVLNVFEDDHGTRVRLEPLGAEPEVCDQRASERIPTIYESMAARLGHDGGCMVLDVSTKGLAVMGAGGPRRGDVLEFDMTIERQRYHGMVTVCSAIEVRPGRFRYGLRTNDDLPGHNLRRQLPDLWVALQIRYLKGAPAP